MKKKSITAYLILGAISIIFVYFKFFYYPTINPNNNYDLMPRFNLQLHNNYYYIADRFKYESEKSQEFQGNYIKISADKAFEKSSKKIYFKNRNFKYGSYLFTENEGEYLFGKMNDKHVLIKHPIPIPEKYKNFIKKLNTEREYKEICRTAEVTPFNDPRFALVNLWYESYIVDLDKEKILWQTGNYYECPEINFKTNRLECGGDLSGKTYVFDKFGNLIKTIGFW